MAELTASITNTPISDCGDITRNANFETQLKDNTRRAMISTSMYNSLKVS